MEVKKTVVAWFAGFVCVGWTADASDGLADAKPNVPDILREAIVEPNVFDRPSGPYLLQSIARSYAEAGQFEEALSAAGKLSRVGWKDSAFTSIAIAQIKAGDVPAARRTFGLLSGTDGESTKSQEIAVSQAGSGEFAAAFRTAESCTDSAGRPGLIARVLKIQAESGDFQAARQRADGLADLPTKELAIATLAGVRAEAGDLPGALRMAERLTGVPKKAEAFRYIVEARRKAGDFAEAARIGARALAIQKGGYNKAGIRLGIVRDLVKTGDIHAALKAAEPAWEKQAPSNMGSAGIILLVEDVRVQAFAEIAEAQEKAGHVQEALQTAEALREPAVKASLLTRLAIARARAGDLDTARSILPKFEEIYFKRSPTNITFGIYPCCNSLSEIAQAQALIGDRAASRASFLRIVKLPETATSQGLVTREQAQAGDVEGALRTAETIRDEVPKSQALESIALVQLKAGDLTGALRTARAIPSRNVRSSALARIGASQARAGDPAAPALFREAREDASHQGPLLLAVAYLQARSGNASEALEAARAEPEPEARTWALLGVARGILARDQPLDPDEPGPRP